MDTGFCMLKPGSGTAYDFPSLEKKYGFKLPPVYKIFATCFELGEPGIIRQQYLDEKLNDYFDLKSYNFYFDGENIGFSHFIELEKAFEVYHSGGLSDYTYKKRLFPFASSDHNGLFIGTESNDADKIFWDRADASLPVIIADNAFDFVSKIEIRIVGEDYLTSGIKHKQLIKTLHDRYWQVINSGK